MEPEGSLPCSQERATCPYPEPAQSSPLHAFCGDFPEHLCHSPFRRTPRRPSLATYSIYEFAASLSICKPPPPSATRWRAMSWCQMLRYRKVNDELMTVENWWNGTVQREHRSTRGETWGLRDEKPATNRPGGPDSSVGIAARYGLDGPGTNPGGRRDFPHPSRLAVGPTQPSIPWIQGLTRGVKRPGRRVDHPPLFSAKVQGRIELYLYSLFWPSWPVLGWIYISDRRLDTADPDAAETIETPCPCWKQQLTVQPSQSVYLLRFVPVHICEERQNKNNQNHIRMISINDHCLQSVEYILPSFKAGSAFLRNVREFISDYTMSHLRWR